MAFQTLAIVMAPAASAAPSCSFAGGVVTVSLPAGGDAVEVQQQDNSQIFFNGSAALCGVTVLTSNTTAINITGGAGVQTVEILMYDELGATVDWGTINWTVSLGTGSDDELFVDNAGGDDVLDLAAGASGIDLNNDGDLDVAVSGVEEFAFLGGPEDDTITAGGSTATGAAMSGYDSLAISGDAGDDTLTGGSGNDTIDGGLGDDAIAGGLGDDALDGAGGTDAVDYSASAAAVNVNLQTGVATGEGLDTLANFENIIGSAFNDTLRGDGVANQITPGPGDDSVNGGAGSDTVDYRDATAAVTVDLDAGTSTGGSGNDTLTSIENARGSAFNDTLSGDSGDNRLRGEGGNDLLAGGGNADDGGDGDILEGGAGIDTVDYSAYTDPVTLALNCLGADGTGDAGEDVDVIRTMENAILTTGDDSFIGNEFANTVWPFGGQNSLNGDGTCANSPAGGGDTLDYGQGYESGVNVNMAGGATAGDSAIGFENARGTAFNDTFVGNASSNRIAGRGGNDNIRGGAGDDTLRGGAGNDTIRGGSGDDDLIGGRGNDRLFGGGGDDFGRGGPGKDRCRGVEVRRSCGTFRNPA